MLSDESDKIKSMLSKDRSQTMWAIYIPSEISLGTAYKSGRNGEFEKKGEKQFQRL